jgi:Flp pilus assembly protein TadB
MSASGLFEEFQTSVLAAIIVLALLVAAVWGLVILLSNPLVQAILVLFAIGAFLLIMKRASED